ncbi:MAG: DUF2183 domain-containing protein, partial [Deltaproteobacteria bacterium]|nr:DUF2183 domain-containing protein [Deltaproteobacteria bacterium]
MKRCLSVLGVIFFLAAPLPALAKHAHIISLGGHGTTQAIIFRGRAQSGKPSKGAIGKGRLGKLASTAHAFMRNDLEHVRIRVVDVESRRTIDQATDDEGFYRIPFPGPFSPGKKIFQVLLVSRKYKAEPILVPVIVVEASKPGLVVLADIDDTIAHTGVPDGALSVAARASISNSEDMRPIPHAAKLLSLLEERGVPVLYVSAGPVELAPRTKDFLARNGFPAGPLFLRYYEDEGIKNPGRYKRAVVAG